MGKRKKKLEKNCAGRVHPTKLSQSHTHDGNSETRVDVFVRQVKNHPFMARVLIIAICILAVTGFFESIQNIVGVAKACYKKFLEPNTIELQQNKIIGVIAEYTQTQKSKINLHKSRWLSLAGDQNETEFWACYSVNDIEYLSVYSVRTFESQRIYHRQAHYEEIDQVVYDGKSYIVIWSREGSGAYLDFSVFSWDGVGGLIKEFPSSPSDEQCGYFQGDIWIINDHAFVEGSGLKYEMVRQDGKFMLQPYIKHPTYGEYGTGCHILRIKVIDDQLKFEFDGDPVSFRKNGTENYKLNEKLKIGLDESLLIDDYVESERSIRILSSSDANWKWKSGLFSSIIPVKLGCMEFSVNDGYGPWYDFEINVESPDEMGFMKNYD